MKAPIASGQLTSPAYQPAVPGSVTTESQPTLRRTDVCFARQHQPTMWSMEGQAAVPDPRRAWLAMAAALALAAAAGWFFVGGGIDRLRSRVTSLDTTGDVGQLAPEFSTDSVGGGPLRLADYRNQVVLLNFWATWCVPCRAEMPEIESTYQSYRERGFQVLAVNVQESETQIKPFLNELNLTFPALLDRDASIARLYRARALPSSFLIDRQGVVQYVRVGPLTRDGLSAELHKLGF